MNLKGVIIGLILVLTIVLGIVKLMENLSERPAATPSYIRQTVGLKKSVKDMTETRKRQIEEEEQILNQP